MRKRLILWLCAAALALLTAACGGSETPPTDVSPVDDTPTTASEPEVVPAEDNVAQPPPPPVVVEETGQETGESVESPAEVEEVAEAPAPPSCNRPWPTDAFGYGVQSHAIVGDPAYAMDVINNQLNMDWVKVQLEWKLVQSSPEDRQWFFYDGVVEQATNQGLCLMLSVVKSPAWTRAANNEVGPPDDYTLYADFLRELINRYPGQIAAIEVWNEQNLDREWQTDNGVSPEDYTRFLQLAYQTIKEEDPNIVVISGALSPTNDAGGFVQWADDFQWMDRAIAAGMLDYADCVGAHHNGYNIPPSVPFDETGSLPEAQTAEFRGPFDNPHHSWSFRTTLDTYAQKIQAVKPDMKICVTEFGWASSEGYDEVPQNFEFARDNSLEEQAQYLVQAFQQMHDSGDVWLAFVFNFDFGNKGGGPTDDPVPYSIVDLNGVPRPAFAALAEMPKPR